jgi:hypothetical protein
MDEGPTFIWKDDSYEADQQTAESSSAFSKILNLDRIWSQLNPVQASAHYFLHIVTCTL